jgi:membrane associated rhomboid family serine protease
LNPASPIIGLWFISQRFDSILPEVRHGEIWRLLTPIFIHFNLMHIVFNMLMLRDMGSLVESRQGPKVLILLVVTIGIGSNLGQYFYNGPEFGGMSGVLYGLLGYIWLRGQCDPASVAHDPGHDACLVFSLSPQSNSRRGQCLPRRRPAHGNDDWRRPAGQKNLLEHFNKRCSRISR